MVLATGGFNGMAAGSTRGVGEGRRGLGSLFRLEVEALVAVASRGRQAGAVLCRAAAAV